MTEENVELTVEGMSCKHCVGAVEKALKQLDGIRQVVVDLSTKKVRVVYDPAAANRQAMKKAIENAGFQVVGH